MNKKKPRRKDSIMIVLGSGGHTGEMLYMMLKYNFEKFKKVYCVIGDNDTLSMGKMKNFVVKNNVGVVKKDENQGGDHRIHYCTTS